MDQTNSKVEDAVITTLWAALNPQKTETYAEFKERDPIGWEEFEALGASVARAAVKAMGEG